MKLLLTALFLVLPLASGAEPIRTKHVTAELIAEKSSAVAGEKFWVGLRLEMAPHWHTYWRFPGDSGLPTKVKWNLPAGWQASEPRWPIPSRIPLPPLMNFGYDGEALIGFEIGVPAGTAAGTYPLTGHASWLVCKEECVPEEGDLTLEVRVAETPGKFGVAKNLFARLREQQPRWLAREVVRDFKVEGESVVLTLDNSVLKLDGAVDAFPLVSQVVKLAEPVRFARTGENISLTFAKADPFAADVSFSAMLVAGKKVFDVTVPLKAPPGAEAVVKGETSGGEEAPGLGLAVLFAFLGGLLLNLMPCVFPVLGIKVMSLVKQNQGDPWQARLHSKIYALGVLCSFWVLTALLLALRSAGQSVGWGFQLQQPGFVMLLILLFSLLTLSLAGWLELGASFMGFGSSLAAKEGKTGSFFTGVLAVIVATPCTAPFMGTAIGVVLAQPAWAIFLVFTSLALGLAAPFVLLSYWPSLLRSLPKPGAWMERLKEFFAFPLAATVVWLLWVYGQQVGLNGLVVSLFGLLMLALSIWIRRKFSGGVGRALALVVSCVGLFLISSSYRMKPAESATAAAAGWKKYSAEAVAAALAEKKAVFVDFTAAWCLTCQVNKNLVLNRQGTRDFFAERKVELFEADWTNQDPAITRALAEHQRIGVPLYLAYPAGSSRAQVLPQILTEEIVRDAFPSPSVPNNPQEIK